MYELIIAICTITLLYYTLRYYKKILTREIAIEELVSIGITSIALFIALLISDPLNVAKLVGVDLRYFDFPHSIKRTAVLHLHALAILDNLIKLSITVKIAYIAVTIILIFVGGLPALSVTVASTFGAGATKLALARALIAVSYSVVDQLANAFANVVSFTLILKGLLETVFVIVPLLFTLGLCLLVSPFKRTGITVTVLSTILLFALPYSVNVALEGMSFPELEMPFLPKGYSVVTFKCDVPYTIVVLNATIPYIKNITRVVNETFIATPEYKTVNETFVVQLGPSGTKQVLLPSGDYSVVALIVHYLKFPYEHSFSLRPNSWSVVELKLSWDYINASDGLRGISRAYINGIRLRPVLVTNSTIKYGAELDNRTVLTIYSTSVPVVVSSDEANTTVVTVENYDYTISRDYVQSLYRGYEEYLSSLNLEKLEEQLEPLNMCVSFVFQDSFEYYEQPLYVTTIKYEGNETCQVNVTIPPTRYPWRYYKYFFLNPLVGQVKEYFDTTNIFALFDTVNKASSLAQSFFVNFIVLLLAADMISGFLGGYSIVFSLPWLRKYTIYTTAYVVVSALASAIQVFKTLHLFIELRASTKFSAELKRIAQKEYETPFKYLPPPLKWQVTKLALEKVLMRFDKRVRKVAICSYPLYKALEKVQEYRTKEGVPGLIKVARDVTEVRSLYKYGAYSVVSSRLYETLDKFYRIFSLSSPMYMTYLEVEAVKRATEKVKETRRSAEERVKEIIERLKRTPLYEEVLRQKYLEMMPLKAKTTKQFIDLVSKDLGVKVDVKFTTDKTPVRTKPGEVVVNLNLERFELLRSIMYNLATLAIKERVGYLKPEGLIEVNKRVEELSKKYLPLFLSTVRPLDLDHVEELLSVKEVLRVAKSREVLMAPDKVEEFILKMSQAYVFSTPEKAIVADYFIDKATIDYLYDLRRIFEERGRVEEFNRLLDAIWLSFESGRDHITQLILSLKDDVLVNAINVLQPHVAMMWRVKSETIPTYVYVRGLVEVARLSMAYGFDATQIWARVIERQFEVTADDKFIVAHYFDWARILRDLRELTKLEHPSVETLEDLERRINQLVILADKEGAHEVKDDLLEMLSVIRKYRA